MSLEAGKTKNDIAWEALFEQYHILERISQDKYFEITASQINAVRESRLMAKFDRDINLPKIFQDHQLSILPISRSQYAIAHFSTHQSVTYAEDLRDIAINFPVEIESIDYTNLYSESMALNCAFNTGIIDDLVGEPTRYTISGRMSTGSFNFNIASKVTDLPDYTLQVENSQCEIDGGFESRNYILLVEAKNYAVDDFSIRQLYYPYRLWQPKTSKKILPVLMTYSNNRFSFFVYEFTNQHHYNSLTLMAQKNYAIAAETIQLGDVLNLLDQVQIQAEPLNIPFPQANRFERIIDLLSLLAANDLSKEEIAVNYQFDLRQSGYYTDACRYLGLVDRYIEPTTNETVFCLSAEGRNLFKKRYKSRVLSLITKILQHQIFHDAFLRTLELNENLSRSAVCELMLDLNFNMSESTIHRRASTVQEWLNWVWKQIKLL